MADVTYTQDQVQAMMQMLYGNGAATNTAGQGEKTAGGVIGALSPALGAIPFVGPAIAGIGSIVSGALEAGAANKQKQQAAKDIAAANAMKAGALPSGLTQHVTADEMASLSDKPGIGEAKDALAQNFVAHMKAIQASSSSGAQSVNAISQALGINGENLNKLMADNADWKAEHAQKFRDDLWNLGEAQHRNIQEMFQNYQKPLYEQATALGNAATANKQTAANTIGGSLATLGTGIVNAAGKQQQQSDQQAMLAALYGTNKTPVSNVDQVGKTYDSSFNYTPTAPTDGGNIITPTGTNPADNLWNSSQFFNNIPAPVMH